MGGEYIIHVFTEFQKFTQCSQSEVLSPQNPQNLSKVEIRKAIFSMTAFRLLFFCCDDSLCCLVILNVHVGVWCHLFIFKQCGWSCCDSPIMSVLIELLIKLWRYMLQVCVLCDHVLESVNILNILMW